MRQEATTVGGGKGSSPTLTLQQYDAFGFDVDHCLAKYNIPELFDQIHFSLADYLVSKKGYDASIKDKLDADFILRGIVMDVNKGNFLKLSENGTILRASHGTKFIDEEDIKEAYGNDRHWPMFDKMIEEVNNIGKEFRIFENFFDMPIMMSAARLIDLVDAKNNSGKDEEINDKYMRSYDDLMEAVMDAYDPKHFALKRGNFFPQFRDQTQDFLQPCSPDVKRWLKRLKQDGRTVFLATSSYNDFAITALTYILGKDWKDYFDFVFTFARKPGFFKHKRPFLKVEDGSEGAAVETIKTGEIYSQGNSEAMMTHLRKVTGKETPKVLFFGDSLRSDVFPSKVFGHWDSVLVLEEMLCEQHDFKAEALVEPEGKKIKLAEPSDREKLVLTSQAWGSFFTDDRVLPDTNMPDSPDVKPMNTLWGYIVRKYADIAVPQLEYIADLELDHEFKVFDHEVPLEWGFYPGLPSALQKKSKDE